MDAVDSRPTIAEPDAELARPGAAWNGPGLDVGLADGLSGRRRQPGSEIIRGRVKPPPQ
ncbi:MAG: hypothetical protein MZV65_41915 [Chromatiales bacterium]|nr:hypothetical protein [Chromatiales bacterium]